MVTFADDSSAEKAVAMFNDRAVDDQVNKVRPFLEKKGESVRKSATLLSKRLYLMNVPYDASSREIENLVKEFAEVEDVVIPRDK